MKAFIQSEVEIGGVKTPSSEEYPIIIGIKDGHLRLLINGEVIKGISELKLTYECGNVPRFSVWKNARNVETPNSNNFEVVANHCALTFALLPKDSDESRLVRRREVQAQYNLED